jgi:serine O-acetyltransferase
MERSAGSLSREVSGEGDTSSGVWVGPEDRLIARLVYAQRIPVIGSVIRRFLRLMGTDISGAVVIGPGLQLPHSGGTVVVHPATRLGRNVTLFHGVTLGRADVWVRDPDFGGFDVRDDVIICTNAVALAKGPEPLVIGRGTVIGANSVLTGSTGEWEIWAGAPARRIGTRARR